MDVKSWLALGLVGVAGVGLGFTAQGILARPNPNPPIRRLTVYLDSDVGHVYRVANSSFIWVDDLFRDRLRQVVARWKVKPENDGDAYEYEVAQGRWLTMRPLHDVEIRGQVGPLYAISPLPAQDVVDRFIEIVTTLISDKKAVIVEVGLVSI